MNRADRARRAARDLAQRDAGGGRAGLPAAGVPIVDLCLDTCPDPAVHLAGLFDVQRVVLDGDRPELPVVLLCGCALVAYELVR